VLPEEKLVAVAAMTVPGGGENGYERKYPASPLGSVKTKILKSKVCPSPNPVGLQLGLWKNSSWKAEFGVLFKLPPT
jgi:hypothetical protein